MNLNITPSCTVKWFGIHQPDMRREESPPYSDLIVLVSKLNDEAEY